MENRHALCQRIIHDRKIAVTLDFVDGKYHTFLVTEDGIESAHNHFDRESAAWKDFAMRLALYGL